MLVVLAGLSVLRGQAALGGVEEGVHLHLLHGLEELGEGDLAALAPRLVHVLSEQLFQLHFHLGPAVPECLCIKNAHVQQITRSGHVPRVEEIHRFVHGNESVVVRIVYQKLCEIELW